MEDLAQKLQSMLNDPESMRNLSELAGMLQAQTAAQPARSSAEPPPGTETAPLPDPAKLLAIGQVLSQMQHDETAKLLLALKPHLSAERAKRTDQAVRMLQLYAAAAVLRENGLLQDLLGRTEA